MPSFHLSLPVPDVDRSVEFFELLGGTVVHRDPSGYVNLDLCGVQVTLGTGRAPTGDGLHFGVNVAAAQFDAIAARLLSSELAKVVKEPHVVDAGTPLERRKLYVRCPAGYLIELKGLGA
jgi:extradiol dioxygenase family protein